MSYSAYVITANNFAEHPNADRLKILYHNGMSFVVGKDLEPGSLVCLFPSDGQLSHDFCFNNNLYRDSEKNKDKTKSGFFEDNRRVRVQPFRGVKSEGFVCTLDYLKWTGNIDNLVDGFRFDTLNGKTVCSKYYSEVAIKYMNKKYGGHVSVLSADYDLPRNPDTDQLRFNINSIPESSICYITEKIHGTSGRTGYVTVTHKKQTVFGRLFSMLFKKNLFVKEKKVWDYVSGTRNTIINNRKDVTTPGSNEYYRWEIHNSLKGLLRKGEVIYYEIVGFDNNRNPIMQSHNTSKLKDKSIQQRFGTAFTYKYGCNKTNMLHNIYVYRISYNGEELSFINMVRRCNELVLNHVPLLAVVVRNDLHDFLRDGCFNEVYANISNLITRKLDELLVDGPSYIDSSHLMEGVCVRVETPHGNKVFKQKNYAFMVLEDIIKEDDDFVDLEEVS